MDHNTSVFAEYDDVWLEEAQPRLLPSILADLRPTDGDAKISGLGHAYVSVAANEGLRSFLTLIICALPFLALSVWLTIHIITTRQLLFIIPLLPSVGIFVLCSGHICLRYRYRRLLIETFVFFCFLPATTITKTLRGLSKLKPRSKISRVQQELLPQKWLKTCSEQHPLCRRPLGQSTFIPPRLLEIETTNDTQINVRLVETTGQECLPSYIALAILEPFDSTLKLTKENLDKLKQDLYIHTLPQIWQTAISLTSQLGYKHLWILQLCVLQDSESEWCSEVSQTGPVFANAACTIFSAATNGPTTGSSTSPAQQGQSHTNSDSAFHTTLNKKAKRLSISTYSSFTTIAEPFNETTAPETPAPKPYHLSIDTLFEVHSNLKSRDPWMLQASLLSRRTIYFYPNGTLLLFECNTMRATNIHPNGIPHFHFPVSALKIVPEITKPLRAKLPGQSLDLTYYYRTRQKVVDPQRNVFKSETLVLPLTGSDNLELSEDQIQRQLEELATLQGSDRRLFAALHQFLRGKAMAGRLEEDEWQEKMELHQAWMDIVAGYSACRFPDGEEGQKRLLPLLGVANLITEHDHARTQNNSWEFIAGSWMELMPLNLLWFRDDSSLDPTRPPLETPLNRVAGTPTWSWASIPSEVSYRRIGCELSTTPLQPQPVSKRKGKRKSRLTCVPPPKSVVAHPPPRTEKDRVKVKVLVEEKISLELVDQQTEAGLIKNTKLMIRPTWELLEICMFDDCSELEMLYDDYSEVQSFYVDQPMYEQGPKGLFGLPLVMLSATTDSTSEREHGYKPMVEVHGILIKKAKNGEDETEIYERVGYFWCSGGLAANLETYERRKATKESDGKCILLQ
ncbi:hypothetical protein QBC43DRAFT_296898 [Cladorrhinum sp. PSN259]|nr:hypothetical protein QBC43DRAFT_296898 [Cladorrhinum sp. PSN259]